MVGAIRSPDVAMMDRGEVTITHDSTDVTEDDDTVAAIDCHTIHGRQGHRAIQGQASQSRGDGVDCA